MQKPSVSAVLTATPVRTAPKAEVQANAKPVNCNRLFGDSQEQLWKREN
jgi:hypothetical protein